jgi:hypothetical protein
MENNTIQKLVDIASLSKYHEKLKGVLETKQGVIYDLEDIRSKANAADTAAAQALTDAKAYADSLASNYDAAGSAAAAQSAAETTAAADATSKATAAETAAKSYADSLVKDSEGKYLFDAAGSATAAETSAKAYADSLATNYDAAGSAAQALTDAKSYVDGKVDGKFDAVGSAAQALADAKADAASLYQVKGDYEAAGTAAGLNTAMDARVKVLEAIDHEKLALDASASAVAAIVAGAESDFDTLKEVADWINSDTTGAAGIQIKVAEHTESINALETDKQDVIEDLASIRSGAAAGATALQSVPEEYITETELAGKGYLTTEDFGFATDEDIDGLFA